MRLTHLIYDRTSGWSGDLPESTSLSTAVFVFADPSFRDHRGPLDELAVQLPFAQIIGCSSAGEISGEHVNEGTMAVAIAEFDATIIRSATATVARLEHSRASGQAIGAQLADPDLRAVFVLSDGLGVNGSELVRGLVETVGEDTVVTGGLAGDGDRFESTWVVGGGKLASGMVAALGFYGDKFVVGSGSMGGWTKFGPERYVTSSQGSVLFNSTANRPSNCTGGISATWPTNSPPRPSSTPWRSTTPTSRTEPSSGPCWPYPKKTSRSPSPATCPKATSPSSCTPISIA